jgi:flavin reductase (DIM6/NTAB) family NADH-FMN oxidoreductase RutF
MQIDPNSLGRQERYKLEIGSIVPRPIALVSTLSPNGVGNLAPFSFFCGVSSNPMTVLFCPSNKEDGSFKDTLRNIEATNEFVINIVSESFVRKMSVCAESLDYEQSEFELAGLETSPSQVIKPPRVKDSKVAFECIRTQILHLNPGAPAGGNVIIGEVRWVYIDDDVINERFHIDPSKLKAVGRMGGLTYCTTQERFDVPWGKKAL